MCLSVSLGVVVHVNLSLPGQYRVGGTVLAQCYSQLSVWVVLGVSLGVIIHVNLSLPGQYRVGGTALAQCYSQLGDVPPDLDDPQRLVNAFSITQQLIQGN